MVSLGDGAAGQDGLVLSSAVLSGLSANQLILSSGTDIGLYGAVNLAPKSLVLNSGALLGMPTPGRRRP